jgi:hypothetical protein
MLLDPKLGTYLKTHFMNLTGGWTLRGTNRQHPAQQLRELAHPLICRVLGQPLRYRTRL